MTWGACSFLLVFLGLALTPLMAAAQARAEDGKKPPTIPADGTEVFLYLLDRAKLQPVHASEIPNLGRYDNVIVIVLGDPSWSNFGQLPLQVARIVLRNGGAALIASDTLVNFDNFFSVGNFQAGDISIINGMVHGGPNTRPASVFQDRSGLPFVVPRKRPAGGGGPEWDIFDGLNRIASNRPSCIVDPPPRGGSTSHLATFPADCILDDPLLLRPSRSIDPDAHFFAVGQSGPDPANHFPYRFLVLSDPSVFINEMMLASDDNGTVDNLEFAARTIGYLADANEHKRTRCLLIQNGQVIERFDALRSMMQPPLPIPNIMAMQEKLTDFANKVVDQFETNDTANKIVVGNREAERNRNFKNLMKVVFALLVFRGLWFLLRRIWQARRPADGPGGTPGGLPFAAKGDRPAGVFDRRQRELLRRNNLYEPVRLLARDLFAEAGAPADAGNKLPEVVFSDVVLRPGTLRDALADLWKIAYGPPRVVTVQRWRLLEPVFERVRQAYEHGKWRFA
jgi:hypothetical protein